MLNRVAAGRWIITGVAVFTAVTPYLADWNETHIFNPRWTAHAKFHNAQTMAFAAVLGVLAIGFCWWRWREGADRCRVLAAGLFAGLYWATQGLAHFYPGVAYRDPEFMTGADLRPLLGVTPQGIIDIVALAITVLGVWLVGSLSSSARS